MPGAAGAARCESAAVRPQGRAYERTCRSFLGATLEARRQEEQRAQDGEVISEPSHEPAPARNRGRWPGEPAWRKDDCGRPDPPAPPPSASLMCSSIEPSAQVMGGERSSRCLTPSEAAGPLPRSAPNTAERASARSDQPRHRFRSLPPAAAAVAHEPGARSHR